MTEPSAKPAQQSRKWLWIVGSAAVLVAAVLTTVILVTSTQPKPQPWSDQRLADALTTQFADLGATITPDMISGILAQDCPYLDDPAALMARQQPTLATGSAEYAGTLADMTGALSLIKQSGRC